MAFVMSFRGEDKPTCVFQRSGTLRGVPGCAPEQLAE